MLAAPSIGAIDSWQAGAARHGGMEDLLLPKKVQLDTLATMAIAKPPPPAEPKQVFNMEDCIKLFQAAFAGAPLSTGAPLGLGAPLVPGASGRAPTSPAWGQTVSVPTPLPVGCVCPRGGAEGLSRAGPVPSSPAAAERSSRLQEASRPPTVSPAKGQKAAAAAEGGTSPSAAATVARSRGTEGKEQAIRPRNPGPRRAPATPTAAADRSVTAEAQRRTEVQPGGSQCESLGMGIILRKLAALDPARVVVIRKINRLGFNATKAIREHYLHHGRVDHVFVVRSSTKHTRDSRCPEEAAMSTRRIRPSGLGFIVMGSSPEAAAIVGAGSEQVVAGVRVSIVPYTPH